MRTYSKEEINAVADALQNHKIIALPTDTVYGVGVMYGDLKDLQRLKNAKHRPETKPIPMMVSSIEHMEQVAVVDERVKKIAEQFLPGALTLVLKVKDNVPKEYTNGLDTIAIRIPDEPFILRVIDELNTPLLVTSANQSGAKTALTSDDVLEQLPDIDGLVLGKCRALQASTIVDCTQEKLKILRPGPITLEQLEACL
ncbi:L-threonylcarbamoyladenylate synthase [Faecalicoccus pleomorphus]|uniref:L-threonylcarbamoyladenylate synthase n=1 Tax=Faecalicoccus pleomorphus TaxID=1323 RepID=UPI00195FB419|nr:L-threonylcarbamoyladenylate synthase [Faecalicoccus pleomorphus]MBM6765311.1 threonylcarbamoyl-AMP synthase [Faecalicoccus pleomorphus]MDB7986885.1 L-threonylcarbamoyladenylate synthase [Faecalicoccus pleomorphus]MDB7991478.1 L-threonylcarbamoyladenylate synthase [Faecalicoccus pleomorphus]